MTSVCAYVHISIQMSRQITQLEKGLFDWWEGILCWKVVWRSFSLAIGAQCVITTGTFLTLWSCAVSWATQEQLKLLDMLPLELEVVHPGITVCIVQGQSVT